MSRKPFRNMPCAPLAMRVAVAALAVLASAASAAPRPSAPPPQPSGYEPAELRSRLTHADSADVAKACGGIENPWADRGLHARGAVLRVYGRRHADGAWAARVSELLLRAATVDTAYHMPPIEIGCDTAANVPIYVVRMLRKHKSMMVVLRFDLGSALCFDSERPLGVLPLGDRADSLWAALAGVLDDDPLLRRPRPAPQQGPGAAEPTRGEKVLLEDLPEAIDKIPPVYPTVARLEDIAGVVYVQAKVGKDGLVKDALVVAGPAALRDAALDAVWQWRFKPALTNHEPVAVWVMIPVKFTLR